MIVCDFEMGGGGWGCAGAYSICTCVLPDSYLLVSQMSATFIHLLRQLNGKRSFWRSGEHSTHTPICILIHADQHSVTDLNISHLMEMPASRGEPLQMCISR